MEEENVKISVNNYTKVSLPKDMISEIRLIIETDKGLGFASAQEFVKDAVRKNIIFFSGTMVDRKNRKGR